MQRLKDRNCHKERSVGLKWGWEWGELVGSGKKVNHVRAKYYREESLAWGSCIPWHRGAKDGSPKFRSVDALQKAKPLTRKGELQDRQ